MKTHDWLYKNTIRKSNSLEKKAENSDKWECELQDKNNFIMNKSKDNFLCF